MTSLLPFPELQFMSNNGLPLSGGTVETCIPSTLTPKTTWLDSGQVAANSNPIALDSAGRCIVYGDGDYRFIVKDSLGNTIYDQLTSSTLPEDAISAAWLPIVGSATLATGLNLLGVPQLIAAAVSAIELMPGPVGPTGPIGPQGVQGVPGSDAGGYAPLITGGSPGVIMFPNANSSAVNVIFQAGQGSTDGGGNATVSYPRPFPTGCLAVVASTSAARWFCSAQPNGASSFSVVTASPLAGGSWEAGPQGFTWIAIGY